MGDWRALKVRAAGAIAVAAVFLGSVSAYVIARDKHECSGGSDLAVAVELQLADAASLPSVALALGVPRDDPRSLPQGFQQAAIVKVRWQQSTREDGWYQVFGFRRGGQPRSLPVHGGWNGDGKSNATAATSIDKFLARCDWIPSLGLSDDSLLIETVGARSTQEGFIASIFLTDLGGSIVTDGSTELLFGLAHIDEDGKIRWAKRL